MFARRHTTLFLLAGALLLGACSAAPAAEPTTEALAVAAAPAQDGAKVMAEPASLMAAPMTAEPVMAAPMTAEPTTEAPSPEAPETEVPEREVAALATPDAGTHDGVMAAEPEDETPASADAMPLLPAWQLEALSDARTGEAFRLADFQGKTVFVEPFATWCTSCKRQFGNLQAARSQLGEEVVLVALSVEPNIGNDALEEYASANGFEFVFAAMQPAMLQALAAQFGQTIANPPATPHFLIRADGSTTELFTGVKSPDEIIAQVAAER